MGRRGRPFNDTHPGPGSGACSWRTRATERQRYQTGSSLGRQRSAPVLLGGLTVLVLALAGVAAPAEVYKWVDSAGRVHFGDRPPPGNHKALGSPAATTTDPHLAERRRKQRRLLEAMQQEQDEKRAAEERAERQQTSRHRECARARHQLEMVDRHGRVYELDAAGERRYWNAQTRERQRARLSTYLEAHCR